jgi:hypothetical protein
MLCDQTFTTSSFVSLPLGPKGQSNFLSVISSLHDRRVSRSRAIPTGRFHSTVSNVYEGHGASGENVASTIHAASMPVHLALHVLSSMDGTGGIVYEPFCGTGTTLIAAERLGRRCFAVELVPQYVETTVTRWQNFTGKAAILERTGESPIPIGENP